MSNTPKFDFNPAPDFTQSLKAGDKVFLWYGSNFRRYKDFNDLEVATVTRLTPKFVVIPHPRFDGDEMKFSKGYRLESGGDLKYPSEIYPYNAETLAVYTELKRRAEIVDSIKRGTSWNLLPTEALEAIAVLMEVPNVN
jgi:hypothetical protein